jgi:large subunit ribosomal protein L15
MQRKRTKRSRLRGSRTAGTGSRQNYRGKGHRGGKGMAGTGKRAGQKRLWVLKNAPDYFGKHGFRSRYNKIRGINIGFINDKIERLVKEGKAKKESDGFHVDMQGYKVLSSGKVTKKLFVKASGFSKIAEEKITKAGGKVIKE